MACVKFMTSCIAVVVVLTHMAVYIKPSNCLTGLKLGFYLNLAIALAIAQKRT